MSPAEDQALANAPACAPAVQSLLRGGALHDRVVVTTSMTQGKASAGPWPSSAGMCSCGSTQGLAERVADSSRRSALSPSFRVDHMAHRLRSNGTALARLQKETSAPSGDGGGGQGVGRARVDKRPLPEYHDDRRSSKALRAAPIPSACCGQRRADPRMGERDAGRRATCSSCSTMGARRGRPRANHVSTIQARLMIFEVFEGA